MAVNIEDAGFEIRDMIAWVYGSGFPKSLNIGKAIDKKEGTEYPKNTLISENGSMSGGNYTRHKMDVQSDLAKQWEGWGTALKPALEPITVARKPLSEKTVAENVLKWGTGGINIDGSRVMAEDGNTTARKPSSSQNTTSYGKSELMGGLGSDLGRFPANLIHDGSDEVVSLFPDSNSSATKRNRNTVGSFGMPNDNTPEYGDKGSAARFFYCPKASKADRDEGLEGRDEVTVNDGREKDIDNAFQRGITPRKNSHPTVKPTKLMQYLVKLVTPKGGVVLDPFMGSGSTGKACKLEGFDFIGIELDPEYCKIAEARINAI